MALTISCGIAPGRDSIELAKLAEDLGYERVWLYDSAALYEDIWAHLALIAHETNTIGLGTAVIVPNLRHVMATASAIATVHRISNGRLVCSFGTGFTARLVLNKTALPWKEVETYLEQLKGLLAGEVVEIEGEKCQMIHTERFAPPRPVDVPILLSAFGPKGQAVAKKLASGLMGVGPGDKSWDWHVQMINGTVLEDGESPGSNRVKSAAGPWYTTAYHAMWVMSKESLEAMPGGPEWAVAIDAERPEGERHLAVHEGHVTDVTKRDQPLLDAAGDDIAWFGWVGTAKEIQARAKEAEAAGTTELLYTPAGPDMEREMKTFAKALIG